MIASFSLRAGCLFMVFFIFVNLSSAVTPTPSSAPTVACGACNRTMTLMFTSDYYASENSWTLKPQGPFSQCTHNVSKAYPNSLENEYSNTPVEVLYEYSLGHLCAFKSYTFTFFDSAGDGCTSADFGQGHWELYVDYDLDGTTLVGSSDCDFASSTSVTFTVPAPPHASLSPSPVPSALPTHSALPSLLPTPSPSPLPTSPTLSPSPAPRQCGACNQTLSLDLFTDAHGNEVTWTLDPLNHAVGCAVNVTYSGGPFPNYSEGHLNTVVLSKQICAFQGYRFTLQDSFGDGMEVFDAGSATLGYYTLTLSGSEVASGTGNFTTEASSDFLASLAPTLAPTPLPTTTPTLNPTLHPVPNPTALPTQHPSLTQHPSRQPTWAPTLAPSLSPSPVPSSEPTSTAGPSLSPSPTAAPTTSMEPTFGPSLEPSKAPASSPPATNPLSTPPDADATTMTTATVLAPATTTSSSPSTRSSAASLNSAVLVVALVAANMCLFCGLAWAKRKILAEKLCNYKAPPPLPSSSLSQNDELPYGGLELFRIEVQAPELKEEEEAPHSTIEERLKSHHARLLDTSGAAVINLQSGDGVGTDGGGGGGGRGGGIYHSVSNDDIDIEDDVTATSKTAGVLSTPQQPVSEETLPGARTVGDGKKGHHEPTLAEKIAARKAAVEHSRHHDEPEVEDEHRLHAEKGSTAQREAMKESRSKSKGSSSSLASAASAVAAKAKAAAAVAPGKSQKELQKERIASRKNKTPIEGSSSTSSTSSSSSSNASSRASTSSSTSSSNASPMLGRKGSNGGSSSKAPNPAPPRGRALSSAKTKAVTTQKKEEQKTALAMRRKMEINAKRPSSSSTKKYEEI